ncbi:hypothetical protein C0991_000681 [Blastosporella zonata]|nr:hypothetical protein C0991_000681 [Blastosporella zonata]
MRIPRSNRDRTRSGMWSDPVSLEVRALINLPIPLPSRIPIIGPLLTPIIGGTNLFTTPTSTTRKTTAPAPTTKSVTVPIPTPTVTTPPAVATADGARNGGDSNSSSLEPDASRSGGSTSEIGGFIIGASATSSSSSPQPSASGASTNVGASATSSSDSGGSQTIPVANAGGTVNTATSNDSGSKSGTSENLGGLQPSSGATISSGDGLTASTALSSPGGSNNNGSSNANDHGISSGAVAGIVIALLLILLVIAIILFRKRSIYHRKVRNQWWARAGLHSSSGDASNVVNRSDGLASIPSQFPTTFDYAQPQQPSISFDGATPLPPMTEVRGSNDGFPLFGSNPAHPDSPVLISFHRSQTPVVANRTSVHSVSSTSSEGQYLEVSNSSIYGQEVATAMSVRPFSPSESFAFPKPPSVQSDWRSSHRFRANTFCRTSRPASDVSRPASNDSRPASDIVPVTPNNPFSDPVPPTTEFAAVESVRRPFVTTHFDELSVSIADSIRVLQVFDDGWALVEKLPPFEEILKTESNGTGRVQGLIPLDCFREERH